MLGIPAAGFLTALGPGPCPWGGGILLKYVVASCICNCFTDTVRYRTSPPPDPPRPPRPAQYPSKWAKASAAALWR
eukprot:scaffold119408_cov16-Phaeocystis_antarctica.AAC.1